MRYAALDRLAYCGVKLGGAIALHERVAEFSASSIASMLAAR
jgi:hypothetical protein